MNYILYLLTFLLLLNNIWFNMTNLVMSELGDEGSRANEYITLLWIGVSLLFIFMNYRKKQSQIPPKAYIRFMTIILLTSLANGIIYGFPKQTAFFEYAQPFLLFLTGFYAQANEKLNKITPYLITMLFAVTTVMYIAYYNQISRELIGEMVSVNAAYFIMYLLPMLMLATNKKYHLYEILFAALIILTSSKRGGILALAVGTVIYYWASVRVKGKSFNPKYILYGFVLIVAAYTGYSFVDTLMGGHLTERFTADDGGSGRELIWAVTWDMIVSSSPIEQLIGHGYNSVKTNHPFGYSAHNDYLEALYDFGWIGFAALLYFIGSSFKQMKTMIQNRFEGASELGLSLSLFVVAAMVSHIIIYPYNMAMFSLFWGVLFGQYRYYISNSRFEK